MWTALVLVWISSVLLSRSRTVSAEPRYLVTTKWPKAVNQSMLRDTVPRADNTSTERTATVPPAPVTLTTGTWAATPNSTRVTAEMTTHRTNVSTPTTREGTPDSVTSRALTAPTSSGPSSVGQTVPTANPGLPSLSTPRAEVPRTNASESPRTAVATTVPPHTTTVAVGTINTSDPHTRTLSPARSTPTNTSSRSPIPTSGAQMQGTTIQVTTDQPVHSTAGRSTPTSSNTTLEPTTTQSVASVSSARVTTTQSVASVSSAGVTTTQSVASVSSAGVTTTQSVASVSSAGVTTTQSVASVSSAGVTTTQSVASVSSAGVTTTQLQTKEPSASIVPVLPTSLSPAVDATSPTTQPSPTLPTQGPGGPGTLLTTEGVETKTTAGTASAGPTSRSSGDIKVPTTDSCQPSTQGQYLVTTDVLTPSLVNKMSLVVVLVVGVTLFIAVLVMFALQAYESYKKKDYTQVDYLINGMYADSEM